MQNANIGLVDITLTCHFEVKDAEVFGGAGSVGYTSVALKHAKAADQLVGIINNSVQCEGFLYAQRKSTADLLGVPVECVRAITYDQYEAATGDDETEDIDFHELDAITNSIVIGAMVLYMSGSLDALTPKEASHHEKERN